MTFGLYCNNSRYHSSMVKGTTVYNGNIFRPTCLVYMTTPIFECTIGLRTTVWLLLGLNTSSINTSRV